jgi:hypothetical protein
LDAAMTSDVTFEKPTCRSPLTVWAVMVAPPSASCGLIVRFSSSKKPCLMPTYSGATSAIGMTPTFSVAGLFASPPPPPLSSPPGGDAREGERCYDERDERPHGAPPVPDRDRSTDSHLSLSLRRATPAAAPPCLQCAE